MEKIIKKCSFCGEIIKNSKKAFPSPLVDGVYICSKCVESCNTEMGNRAKKQFNKKESKSLTPKAIKDLLDEVVIEQDTAKKGLAVALYDMQKAKVNPDLICDNILLLGDTGVGKTWLIKNAAKILGVPYSVNDASILTASGYVGESVDKVLIRLIESANYDIKKAEHGIIFLDEIDKIATRKNGIVAGNEIKTDAVQSELLTILNGTIKEVTMPGGKTYNLNTKNILFIFGGAFEGISDIIERRITGQGNFSPLGNKKAAILNKDNELKYHNELISKVEVEDLKAYGLKSEFIGRISSVYALNRLSRDNLVQILKLNCGLIAKYKESFSMDNIELEVEEDALYVIADEAVKQKTGARALSSKMEKTFRELKFNTPSIENLKKITITKDFVSAILNDKPAEAKFEYKSPEEIEASDEILEETIEGGIN